MSYTEITNKLLAHLAATEEKSGSYDECFQDAAVFGSSFLKFNPDTMTYELVPRDEFYKTEWVTEEEETKTPLPDEGSSSPY